MLERLPRQDNFSVQTVGRRVNDLFDDGLIHAIAIADKDTNRTLITAYELTEKGENALEEGMERFLKEKVRSYVGRVLLHEDTALEEDLSFVQHTFCDLYDIPYDAVADAGMEEILCLLQSYYCDRTLTQFFEEEAFVALVEAVEEHSSELTEVLAQRRNLFQT